MDYVKYLGKVPFRELVELHQQATFTVSSSLHEASSFPILEAAAAGTPVIASKIPAFEELAETLQLNLFDPLNVQEIAELVFTLWNDQQTAASQAAYNRIHIRAYSWDNAANGYLRFFQRILDR
jgi:glycosyltransferase involved in cell wall biosynthesis